MSTGGPRPRSLRLNWLVLALAVLAVLYLSRAYSKRARRPVYPPNAFYQVKRADMLVSVTEEGALRALNETIVRNSLEGVNRIIQLPPEGSHVKKGDLLVELDSSGLKDRLSEQELAYQERLFQLLQAQGNLKIQKSLTESQIKDAELKVENAESDLEKYRDGDAPLLIKTVEARSGVLTEQVRIARERYARTQELFKEGNATKSEYEADALSLTREELALDQYEEDLRLFKRFDQPNQVRLLESQLEEAKKELDRLKQRTSNEIAQAEADLKTSERTVAFLDESIKTQKRRLENAKIFAPQDGLVVYASVSPFQSMADFSEVRRDDSRLRGGRGPGGGGGGGDSSREFRGGGRRGRSGSESGSSGSTSASASTGSNAQSVSAANQRIASAISGSAETQTGGGTGTAGGGGGGASGGSRSGGGGASGGGEAQSASRSFVTYPSMRPSSTIPTANANSGATSGGSGSGSLGSSGSLNSGSQSFSSGLDSQFGVRSRSQGFGSFGGFEPGTSGFVEEGMMVRQRQELIRLPDVSKMVAEIKIHESRVREVRPGMTAYVRIENIPNRSFKGTVRKIAPLPDSQMSWLNPNLKVYPTDVLIEDELPELKPGVSARAEVIITNLTKVLSVPIHTVARRAGENVCFIKKGSGVVPVPVTTGWFNDQFLEITSGLKEGDLVLLAPMSDEPIESAPEETNIVEIPVEEAPRAAPQQPVENAAGEGRRMQRDNSNSESSESDRPTERRRNRQGSGRRSQGSQEVQE